MSEKNHGQDSSRQHAGFACQECRRKKSRCDRKQPCGNCDIVGVNCSYNSNRPQRGPKKGHLRDLRTRIATLENYLLKQPEADLSFLEADQDAPDDADMDMDSESPHMEPYLVPQPSVAQQTVPMGPSSLDRMFQTWEAPQPIKVPAATNELVTGIVHAELDQLFFDRSHFFAPFLEPSSYLSWSRQKPCPSESHRCLQNAVWTLAAARSSSFQYLRDTLYDGTRKMLADLELDDHVQESPYQLQRTQALLLTTMYEFAQNLFTRAWSTAGRALRLVQILKLDRMDLEPSFGDGTFFLFLEDGKGLANTEEKRRTFWVAYCIDRLLSGSGEMPTTLSEDNISTRLPAVGFHDPAGQKVATPFLRELLCEGSGAAQSPLVEYIIFSTLWARVTSQDRQYANGSGRTAEPPNDHQSFEQICSYRLAMFTDSYTQSMIWADPLLLFTGLMAQCITLKIGQIADSARLIVEQPEAAVTERRGKMGRAVDDMVKLSASLSQMNVLKPHPFLSIPLSHCARYLATLSAKDADSKTKMLQVVNVLKDLGELNLISSRCWHSLLDTSVDIVTGLDNDAFFLGD